MIIYTYGVWTKVLHCPVVCCGLCSALWYMLQRNLNTETQKSEQTLFAQISVSILRFFNHVCCKVFQGLQHKTGPCRTLVCSIYLRPLKQVNNTDIIFLQFNFLLW